MLFVFYLHGVGHFVVHVLCLYVVVYFLLFASKSALVMVNLLEIMPYVVETRSTGMRVGEHFTRSACIRSHSFLHDMPCFPKNKQKQECCTEAIFPCITYYDCLETRPNRDTRKNNFALPIFTEWKCNEDIEKSSCLRAVGCEVCKLISQKGSNRSIS